MKSAFTSLAILFLGLSAEAQSPQVYNTGWEIYVGLADVGTVATVSAANAGNAMWGAGLMLSDSLSGQAFQIAYTDCDTSPSEWWPYGFDFIESIELTHNNYSYCTWPSNGERYLPYSLVRLDFNVGQGLDAGIDTYSIYLDIHDDRFWRLNHGDIWIRFSLSGRVFEFCFGSFTNGQFVEYSPGSVIRICDYYNPSTQSTSRFQPTTPTNLQISWDASYTHPQLRWNASEPSSAVYDIYRRPSTSNTYTQIASYYPSTVYVDSSTNCGRASYCYKVVGLSRDYSKTSPGYAESIFSTYPCPTLLAGSTEPTNNNGAMRTQAQDLKRRKETNSVQQKYSSFITFQPNTLRGYLSNNGLVFADTAEGLFWPANTKKNLVFSSGFWTAGKDEADTVRSAVSYYLSNYQPGTINGAFVDTNYSIAGNPYAPVFKMVVLADTSTPSDEEYQRWVKDASLTGAPLNNDGTPKLVGNLNAYWVMDDLDTSGTTAPYLLRPQPMGLEIHNYVFGYNEPGPLSQTIFLVMNIINKSVHTYNSTYFGWFSDVDLGDPNDDLPGCDTLLSLGYMYNGKDTDKVYGIPPACGFVILKSPAASESGAKMTSFMKDMAGPHIWQLPGVGDSIFARKAFLVLSGKRQDGYPWFPPNEPGHVITYVDPGDPVTGTGWLATAEQSPADDRFLQGSGPFTFMPGDTESFVVAFIVAQDTSRFSSITKLRRYIPVVRAKWNEVASELTDITEKSIGTIPKSFLVSEGYPNPFNPSIAFRITLPERSMIDVKVYDILGREVRQLISGKYTAGTHEIGWDGKNDAGTMVSSGAYFCVFRAYDAQKGGMMLVRKIVMVK
ncbi:MAG: hypothetical protein M1470_12855 [Bacteroidetes bacterium]|nr:hypothetical protein [Bacteroidota bacterium]